MSSVDPNGGLYRSTPTVVFIGRPSQWVFIGRPPTGVFISRPQRWSLSVDPNGGLYQSTHAVGLLHCVHNLIRKLHLYQYQFRPFNLRISIF